MIIEVVLLIIFWLLTVFAAGWVIKLLNKQYKDLSFKYEDLSSHNEEVMNTLSKTIHQKKSSEVRLGKIGENLAPFTKSWPWDPNNFRFLGSPIDGIQFTDDMIYLVEIKTGNSRLSKKQEHCKDLVKQGKVSFVSYRINTDGITLEDTTTLK